MASTEFDRSQYNVEVLEQKKYEELTTEEILFLRTSPGVYKKGTHGVDHNGRCNVSGTFLPGFAKAGPGRPKGSRSKMTKLMLQRVAERSEPGMSMEEIMMDIAQDRHQVPELRFKAAKAVADLVYPKASSVEVKTDDADSMTREQIDQKLASLIAAARNS